MKNSLFLICVCLVFCVSGLKADDIPFWLSRGIPCVESSSYYDESNQLIYVDRRDGKSGELGPFQMMRIAFNQVKRKGEKFEDLREDMEFAEELFLRYIEWIKSNYSLENWEDVCAVYHCGYRGYKKNKKRGNRYVKLVKDKYYKTYEEGDSK